MGTNIDPCRGVLGQLSLWFVALECCQTTGLVTVKVDSACCLCILAYVETALLETDVNFTSDVSVVEMVNWHEQKGTARSWRLKRLLPRSHRYILPVAT